AFAAVGPAVGPAVAVAIPAAVAAVPAILPVGVAIGADPKLRAVLAEMQFEILRRSCAGEGYARQRDDESDRRRLEESMHGRGLQLPHSPHKRLQANSGHIRFDCRADIISED